MAKKKTNYMAEKRFSLNDLLIGGGLLIGVFFFAVVLYGANLYGRDSESSKIISFNGGLNVITSKELMSFYEDKVSETASTLVYGDELYYTVLDINNDGVEDLILKVITNNNVEFRFYTFDYNNFEESDNVLVFAGTIGGNTYSSLYTMSNENFVMFVSDTSYYVYLEDNMISTFQVNSYELPSNDNLINFYDYTDLSLFD